MDSNFPPENRETQPDSTQPVSTRRQFLGQLGGAVAAGLALSTGLANSAGAQGAPTPAATGAASTTGTSVATSSAPPVFELYSLPYPVDALEPVIDQRTMEIHHGRHHKAYVDNLNKIVAATPSLAGLRLRQILNAFPDLPASIQDGIRNNGGGHYNHSLFWEIMQPVGSSTPAGELKLAIDRDFGSVDAMKSAFVKAGLSQFGSGWVFLVLNPNGNLTIETYPNQDCPLMFGKEPILGNDLWEHAYYLSYRNRRQEYLESWWSVVNWDKVSDIFNGEHLKI